ncbi:hypothetical protein [Acidocella sp. KAb 2-4]|uniref:hypothetical protein n=1 Tax=Acidocella sp. KAb 2-4 TaxID=2885158 RepID=UPI001D08CE94|nr:hypothetical protein [Acidocella sp. KAb 2-4]MCB5945301.1 hypothetical protein [Acidocella sp. KAb 2-4]
MQTERNAEDERHHASLNEILEALGEEFHELGRFAEQFQSSLSPALLEVAKNAECHRDVQSLDLLAQRLGALAKYVLTISRLLPEEWRVNPNHALNSITLSDLQYRLKGVPVPEDSSRQSGEFELF